MRTQRQSFLLKWQTSNSNSFEDAIINVHKYFKIILDSICNFESKGGSGKVIIIKTQILDFFFPSKNNQYSLKFICTLTQNQCIPNALAVVLAEFCGPYGPTPECLTTLYNVLSFQRDYFVIRKYAYRPAWQNKHTSWWCITLPSIKGL